MQKNLTQCTRRNDAHPWHGLALFIGEFTKIQSEQLLKRDKHSVHSDCCVAPRSSPIHAIDHFDDANPASSEINFLSQNSVNMRYFTFSYFTIFTKKAKIGKFGVCYFHEFTKLRVFNKIIMINRAARIIFCLNEKIGKGLKAILNSTAVNSGSHTMG